MNLLFLNKSGKAISEKDTCILPRVGDKVDMFYSPFPEVVNVLLYSSEETLEGLTKGLVEDVKIDAIISVE